MKAIILAAGRGTRISRYLSGKPKCTVDIGDEILIEYTVKLLQKKGISNIALVVGYNSKEIKNVLKDYDIKYYENPFYDVTNSIASLWFAKECINDADDMIIMNGDVFIEEALLDNIMMCNKSPVMFADNSRRECADYKFKYSNGILEKYGKELEGVDITGEYIGIGKFCKDFIREFYELLIYKIERQQHNVWWENILYDMVGSRKIYVEEVGGKFWAEVDYIEDYERILLHRGYKAEFDLRVHK